MADRKPVFDHRPQEWTVGQLRASLEGVDDDKAIILMVADAPGSSFASGFVMVSAEAVEVGAPGPRLVLTCDYPSGAYLAPQSGTITVHYPEPSTPEEELIVAGLNEKVQSALTAAGFNGSRVMDRADPGATTWTVTSEQPVVDALEAARVTIEAANPGQWALATSTN